MTKHTCTRLCHLSFKELNKLYPNVFNFCLRSYHLSYPKEYSYHTPESSNEEPLKSGATVAVIHPPPAKKGILLTADLYGALYMHNISKR